MKAQRMSHPEILQRPTSQNRDVGHPFSFLDWCERGAELPCGCGYEYGEQDQQEGLGDLEGGLGAGGGEGVEGGDVLEGLGDEDEDVEVEGDHGGDGVGAAPSFFEVEDVEGDEGDGEHDDGQDAEDDAWSHFVVGEAEAGEAGQDGGDEKP